MTIQKIKAQFDEVIKFCYCIDDPKTDELFKKWEKAKSNFLNYFGGPIYEIGPVKMSLSEELREEKVGEFLNQIDQFGSNELKYFVDANRDGFFDNKVLRNYTEDNKNISAGTKMLKSFKYFIKDPNTLSHLQNLASNIIQEDKVEGTLCLSVHPLDYLSLSENCHNWRSCHALDGDYAEGNVSYMLDSSTVICYIKSDNGDIYRLPNFPESVRWNSKKWRMLLFFSDEYNAMMAGRQYPMDIEGILPMISENILKVLKLTRNKDLSWFDFLAAIGLESREVGWSDWDNSYLFQFNSRDLQCKHIYIGDRIYPYNTNFITDGKNSRHFNDLLSSSFYKNPYYCYAKEDVREIHFSIGTEVPCLNCGSGHTIGLMRCSTCLDEYNTEDEDIEVCSCCDRNIYSDESCEILYDGSTVCANCAQEMIQCHRCGYLVSEDEVIVMDDDRLLCPFCAKEED